MTNPSGMIFTDFNNGEAYFQYLDNGVLAPEKIVLLRGLREPRHFWLGGNKVAITNDNEIYSYDWDGKNLKLINSQKIGNVPTGCVENTHHFPR